MSAGYRAVQWSPGKRRYDGALGATLAAYLAIFLAVTFVARPEITLETALIRAFGTAALALLHLVLAIGPLARLDRRFLPLLWNRRHLGVTMFLCALAHGVFALVQFHALGVRNPLVSLLATNRRFDSLAQFPFEPLGLAALAILFLMAATSHDFWLANLTAPVWKALHMGVYAAYALVVAHVALGALQDERAPALVGVLAAGLAAIVALHLAAAAREWRLDRAVAAAGADGYVACGRVEEIAEGRARVVTLAGERVAVFRNAGTISALSNVCQHQNGPLGEGRIVDGCVTCPWHGYQYRPEDGRAPAPFSERVPTFRVRVERGVILVDPRPLPPGTPVEPARFDPATPAPGDREAFFVGYLPLPRELRNFLTRSVVAVGLLFGAVAGIVASQQSPLGAGVYEYGVESQLEGVVRLEPVPSLWTTRAAAGAAEPGAAEAVEPPLEVVPLVGAGKRGPPPAIVALAGRPVRARGSWIRRGPERLFEIVAAEAVAGGAASPAIAASALGGAELRGEIVDSKCFLGVMKPGEGKSHKACAVLCIEGGSPAALVARTATGETALFWLVGGDGRPLGRELLDVVGEPVAVAGELLRVGARAILVTDRAKIRRVEAPAS
ncbi:MAG: ferric reductase-like transmembrane domain-containing protein [Thermoanaerobaculia bacterium]|nr:ferric reductase-like transmembrane domain-containing protein [Thermoanaerobaculia bacterium]